MMPTGNTRLLLVLSIALINITRATAYECPEASITVIEDRSSRPAGLFVSTSKDNYGIYSPSLESKNWLTVEVNNNYIRIINDDNNNTLTSKTVGLSRQTKAELSKLKNDFTDNLGGLSLTTCNILTSSYNKKGYYPPGNYPSSARSYNYVQDNYVYPTAAYQQQALPAAYIVYNNLIDSPLQDDISGDVYHLCLSQPSIDIYSSSVNIFQNASSFSIYRDYRYFVYKEAYLANNLNTIVLYGNLVFFVYNDKTVRIKTSVQLDYSELELVLRARSLVKELDKRDEDAEEFKEDDSKDLDESQNGGNDDGKDRGKDGGNDDKKEAGKKHDDDKEGDSDEKEKDEKKDN